MAGYLFSKPCLLIFYFVFTGACISAGNVERIYVANSVDPEVSFGIKLICEWDILVLL